MKTEVIRSSRRKKTVEARITDGVMRIRIPATMSAAEEAHWVEKMRHRFAKQLSRDDIDLPARARRLADAHDLPVPVSIRFTSRQTMRWGSCSPASRTIRLSDRLTQYPRRVLDYVIVHELAHLAIPNHSADYWRLVNRYKLAERARGFLIAKQES